MRLLAILSLCIAALVVLAILSPGSAKASIRDIVEQPVEFQTSSALH
jgi:hypothetical protein